MGVAALALFVAIFYNKYTRIITAAIIILATLFVLMTLERWETQAQHLYDLRLMISGYAPYRADLGLSVLWAVSLLLGLAVAIFMLYRFSFYILALTGIAIFLFTWGPGFTRDTFSFLIFIVCFLLLLIRKTNNSLAAVYVAAPICIVLVWFIYGTVPREADLFQRRTLQDLFDGPLSTIGDFIYTLTNPMYFSFQSTGFSGHGGRLGGPVAPNARNVMTVQAPGRTYLAGITHNTYTGYRWMSTLEHGQLYTQGMALGRFEMLETTASLIRGATIEDPRMSIPMSLLWNIFPVQDHRGLAPGQFATLGMEGYSDNIYLHTYLPMDQVTIAIGANRTGTVFRPQNTRQLWFHAASPDYLPNLMFDPSGDMRSPGFMSRGTQYSMSFLNVNHRLSFIEDILQESQQGMYAQMEPALGIVYDRSMRLFALNEITEHENPDVRIIELWREMVEIYSDILAHETILGVNDHEDGRLIMFNVRDGDQQLPAFDPFTIELEYELEMTAEDMNFLFEMFAFQGPTRELNYMHTSGLLTAKLDAFSRDVLSRYAETIREHFMYVPEIVPQRVHDLTHEIIYGADTDFERVMAIRDYLIQFPYTLSPPPVPDGVCFVDHFLFDAQMGYCTYYASAMAVMARIAGVPSRYVEGFLLPPAEEDPSVFAVTNMMAHAWVEVYFEGFGWLIVEATAPYAFFTDPGLIPPPGAVNPYWQMHEWWYWWEDEFMHYDMGQGWAFDPDAITPHTPVEVATGRGAPTFAQVRIVSLIIFGVIIGLALLFIILRFAKVALGTRRIRKLPINQQIGAYFNGIIDITSYCASPKDRAETPHAYGQRMGRRFRFKSDSVGLKDLVDLYYKARYGSKELSDEERKVMEISYNDMVNHLRYENRRPNYLYLRYIRQIGVV